MSNYENVPRLTDSILTLMDHIDGNNRQFLKCYAPCFEQGTIDNQLSAIDVIKILDDSGLLDTFIMYEKDIREMYLHSRLKVHGAKHIVDVLLYSIIIGQSIIKDMHDIELLMLAAKYHDISRKTDSREDHAAESANIAVSKLSGKYPPTDLAIIKTVIEFHEVSRSLPNVDEVFAGIARKNGIPDDQIPKVRRMAEVLKDADSLDRTRFINGSRLDPTHLSYDISRYLVQFASALQETLALQDLKTFQCDESINVLLNYYSPQEISRAIRHNVKDTHRLDSVHRFIASWAAAPQEFGEFDYFSRDDGRGHRHS